MRWTLVPLLLAAACGKDPEIDRLNGVVESLRKEMADERARKDKEIADLRTQLDEARKREGIAAEAEALKREFDAFRAAAEASASELRQGLEAKAREAADALARLGDVEKAKAGLDAALKETKALLGKNTTDLAAVKNELANLKKLLGR